MAGITLDCIAKVYPNGFKAVDDVNLDISDGEFVVLVGPSGCGKSTTLRMIAGLEEITGGQIGIDDRIVNEVHPKDRDIAMVFQNYALYPHMTVYKNMSFALKLRRTPKEEIDRRVREAARVLGIEELLERKPRQLSGGQRQRVAVGRAIVREPKAFLFDEPLSNLDAKLRVTMRAELKALHRRLKTTSVYVTHDQEEAMTLGDRIVVMAGGCVQQVGPPLEVYHAPVNRFVASFVGSPPMNFIEGTLERDGGAMWFLEDGVASSANRVLIPRDQAEAIGNHDGAVVFGVRPQSMSEPVGGGASAGSTLSMLVELVEPLGEVMDVSGTTAGGRRLVARVNSRSELEAGVEYQMPLDFGGVHVFAPGDFGENLSIRTLEATAAFTTLCRELIAMVQECLDWMDRSGEDVESFGKLDRIRQAGDDIHRMAGTQGMDEACEILRQRCRSSGGGSPAYPAEIAWNGIGGWTG